MVISRIVIGIDFAEPSVRAAEWASRVLAPGAEVVLTHVIEIPGPPGPLRVLARPAKHLEMVAREGAERMLRIVSNRVGLKRAWLEIRRGERGECLHQVAEAYRANLSVVGAQRHRSGPWNSSGSTSERLLKRARVPVVVAAMPPDRPPRHILAATDGSPISSVVLSWARDLAARYGAALTQLSVVSSVVPSHALVMDASDHAHEDHAYVRWPDGADGRDGWIAREFGPGEAAQEVSFGEPGQEILAAAARHDSGIIVMGRRGTGRARRALFGSVTRGVLRGARCPVLVAVESEEMNDAPAQADPGADT